MPRGELREILLSEGFPFPLSGELPAKAEMVETPMGDSPSFDPSLEMEEDDISIAEISPSTNATRYEDPWLVLAGWAFSSQYMEERPVVNVWAGGTHRLQDKLSPKLLGSERTNSLLFTAIRSHEEKMHLLFNHTHWGHFLQMCRRSGRNGREKHPMRYFSNTLFRRISFFIRGLHDPIWTAEEKKLFWSDFRPRNKTYRAQRLLEVLKTVDGMFLQRFLSYPEEIWTWEKFDVWCIQALSKLLTDEFFDGELSLYSMDEQTTFYEELKRSRKTFKLVIHQDEPLRKKELLDGTPRWVQSFLRPAWDRALKHDGFSRLFLAGTLSQTRGSGTPPPLVTLRSKRKFLRSVSEHPGEMSKTQTGLIRNALDRVLGEIPDHVFTGLDTKARVTVTGSACWEATRREGGTAQAILELMSKYETLQIPVRNLETGKITGYESKDSFGSIGTAVFHACLDEVLKTPLEELRSVFLTVVKEPSKARVVTKGRASLKIVLDTVSRIVSYPLKKGLRSSQSGMGKSHHGWNLFRDFTSEEMYETLFSEDRKRRVEDEFHDHVDRVQYWEDVYFSSTDYQEATDRLVHPLGRIIGHRWMQKCGIPQVLQGIVLAVCFQPRTVYFNATGALEKEGRPTELDGIRKTTLYRGVLMGDPLTKVILHLTNIIVRRLGEDFSSGQAFVGFRNAAEAFDALTG
jgi:hypothetical protein